MARYPKIDQVNQSARNSEDQLEIRGVGQPPLPKAAKRSTTAKSRRTPAAFHSVRTSARQRGCRTPAIARRALRNQYRCDRYSVTRNRTGIRIRRAEMLMPSTYHARFTTGPPAPSPRECSDRPQWLTRAGLRESAPDQRASAALAARASFLPGGRGGAFPVWQR
jgi:hypothetical protein